MSVEDMRHELGRDSKLRGERIHEGASEEFVRGYQSQRGFGSNVTPRKFGAGGNERTPWTCVCGTLNKRYLSKCASCNVARAVAMEASND